MAYTKFANNKPDIADDGTAVVDNTRDNLEALRDNIVTGVMPDWPLDTVTGPSDEPTELIWKNGVLWLRAQITWGSAGGADGNPTSITYSFSGNSGGAYDTIATLTLSYNTGGDCTGSSWA